ncbi:hypothetical protein P8452_71220 [Trifolium repens]|nr:hypothetical protein QL285_045369 [Trifolium repens]WJX89205.1 hypothetical protein P8452_71220 [Trifolium repens]
MGSDQLQLMICPVSSSFNRSRHMEYIILMAEIKQMGINIFPFSLLLLFSVNNSTSDDASSPRYLFSIVNQRFNNKTVITSNTSLHCSPELRTILPPLMPPLSLIAAINSNHRSIIHPHSLNSNIV